MSFIRTDLVCPDNTALNLILLATFTGLESITIGSVVSYYNQTVVLQALIITSFVFIGLTLFTFQVRIVPLLELP